MFFSSGLWASQMTRVFQPALFVGKLKILREDPEPISDAKISDLLKGDGYRRASDCCKVQRTGKPSTADRKREHKLKTLITT